MDTNDDAMAPIEWHRVKLPAGVMAEINRRSDAKGFAQAGGFLLVLGLVAAAACHAAYHGWPWWITLLLIYLYGTVHSFLVQGFHELCHGTVFKSSWLNAMFLRIYSFLAHFNYVHFQESHRQHHRYTLHQPGDLEVTLPIRWGFKWLLRTQFINIPSLWQNWRTLWRASSGQIIGEWNLRLFPNSPGSRRGEFIRWGRTLLIGHAAIALVAIITGQWIILPLVTFPYAYGTWLQFLCNATQHVGLQDKVPDFRLCCRTIYLNPVLQFLYWHMNYHIEHHMYAAVPCYNLGKLHQHIRPSLPPTANGLTATWQQIIGILWLQEQDPDYQYVAPLPVNTLSVLDAPSQAADVGDQRSEMVCALGDEAV